MNVSNTEWEKIQDKLNALKNLAEHPGTAGEAAAATAALQRLLFKHNMSMEDIKVASKGDDDGYTNADYTIGVKYTTVEGRWKYQLLRVVAGNNFCRVLHYSHGLKLVNIVGEPHNIVATKAMYEYLLGELNRLCRRDMKIARAEGHLAEGSDYDAQVAAFEYAFSWRSTAIANIAMRLKEQRREDEQTYTGGSALVVAKNAQLENAISRLFPDAKTSQSRGSNYYDAAGARAGREAGKSVGLNRQVGGGENGGQTALPK
jgi:hypothetical protein